MSSPHARKSPPLAVTKRDRPVLVFFPEEAVEAMDEAARRQDTDRSKWIRRAIREALAAAGITN